MKSTCIIATANNSILNLAVNKLINLPQVDLTVLESSANSYPMLVNEIKDHKADVVILDKSFPFPEEDMFARLLLIFPSLLVVVINDGNNWLHLFRRQDILLSAPEDFLQVILSS